jgi:hypothetical protein
MDLLKILNDPNHKNANLATKQVLEDMSLCRILIAFNSFKQGLIQVSTIIVEFSNGVTKKIRNVSKKSFEEQLGASEYSEPSNSSIGDEELINTYVRKK